MTQPATAPPEVEISGDEPTALYRFYDRENQLLYVGISANLAQRWEDHATDKFWWPRVARKTAMLYGSRRAALHAESVAIITESPLHNIAGQQDRQQGKELALKRLERKLADAERLVREGSYAFACDEWFQSRIEAYAQAQHCNHDRAVGSLLYMALTQLAVEAGMTLEERLAAMEARVKLRDTTAA